MHTVYDCVHYCPINLSSGSILACHYQYVLQLTVGAHQEVRGREQWAELEQEEEEEEVIEESLSEGESLDEDEDSDSD